MENSNLVQGSLENKENRSFEVRKIPFGNGFIYEIYFSTEEEAIKALESFWDLLSPSTKIHIESGMIKPFRDDITDGPRTSPRKLNPGNKYSDKLFAVQFNGNTGALQPRGEDALRQLGYIE